MKNSSKQITYTLAKITKGELKFLRSKFSIKK